MMRARRDEADGDIDDDDYDKDDENHNVKRMMMRVLVRHRCSRELRCKYCDSNSLEISCFSCTPPCLRAVACIDGDDSDNQKEKKVKVTFTANKMKVIQTV